MRKSRCMASCFLLLVPGVALAANPDWKTGVVREVDNRYARVTIDKDRGTHSLKGRGSFKQYCTIEVGRQLVTGESEVHVWSRFFVVDDKMVVLRISGNTMTVKDSAGKERTFHVLQTMPDTPANMPDRTAFAERALVQ